MHQLAHAQLTGTLLIKDLKQEPCATISLLDGRLLGCRVGRLDGADAIYQLLEKPVAGTFVFSPGRSLTFVDVADPLQPTDIEPMVEEGKRRHDEYWRACAVIPDDASLRVKGGPPPSAAGEQGLGALE